MDIESLKQNLSKAVDEWYKTQPTVSFTTTGTDEVVTLQPEESVLAPERVLPEGKRVVRTKSSGDRVYLLDENQKTRQWVTNGDILQALGFEFGDVVDVDDNELMKYNMGPAIYRVD